MRTWLVALACLAALAPGRAWSRRPVPLLPPPAKPAPAAARPLAYAGSDRPYPAVTAEASGREPRGGAVGWGVELGLSGSGQGTSGDALGMQFLWGGRLFARIPLSSTLFLKASLGYFRRAERGGGSSGVTQQTYEGGLSGYYSLAQTARLRVLVGVAQKLDLLRSTIVTPGASGDSPLGWQYRLGPAAGLAFGLSPEISLVTDAEVTFGGLKPVRTFAGFSAGLLFFFR